MDEVTLATRQFLAYILILFRVGGLMIFAPLLGSALFAARIKVAAAAVISLALIPVITPQMPETLNLAFILKAAAGETAVGLVLGYAANVIFVGVQLAGMQIGQQMGIGIASIFNPLLESQTSLIAQFYNLFAIFIYLAIGGHHLLLSALVDSFQTLPAGWMVLSGGMLDMLISLFAHLFGIAFAVSAPVILALFLTTVAMGFVARTVPQMNILIVGFPVRALLALVVMIFTLPAIGNFLARTIGSLLTSIARLMTATG